MVIAPDSAQTDGPDDECVSCAGSLRSVAGESLIGGRNHWFLETRCAGCGLELLECGRNLPPEPVRSKLLELTESWVATIDSSSTTSVMRALRKVYGGTIAEARELADRMRESGLSGTRGELLVLQRELEKLGVHARIASTSPGTQQQLPDRPAPTPPCRIGRTPPHPPTDLVPDAIAEPERSRIARYLRNANCIVATAGGCWVDQITRDPRDRIREAVMTDGVYVWSIVWATLVERHGIGLPAGLLDHAQTLRYQPPELTPERLQQITVEVGLDTPKGQ